MPWFTDDIVQLSGDAISRATLTVVNNIFGIPTLVTDELIVPHRYGRFALLITTELHGLIGTNFWYTLGGPSSSGMRFDIQLFSGVNPRYVNFVIKREDVGDVVDGEIWYHTEGNQRNQINVTELYCPLITVPCDS